VRKSHREAPEYSSGNDAFSNSIVLAEAIRTLSRGKRHIDRAITWLTPLHLLERSRRMPSAAMTMDSTHSRDIFRASGFKKCGKSGKNYASTEEQITSCTREGGEKRNDEVAGGRRGKMKTREALLKWNANPSWKLHRPRTNKRHSFRPRLNV